MTEQPAKGTRAAIPASYREQLKGFAWAADEAKLERFMSAAAATLGLPGEGAIDRTGHCWLRALELNGVYGAKARTLKALKALP